jgi:hypothetical protein
MNNVFEEGNLLLDFTIFGTAERFDATEKNAYGMKPVDFVAESDECLYFIEVKDYQHPKATQERQDADLKMLSDAMDGDKSVFVIEMGTKIKDSLLRRYAEGCTFPKKVMYLLFINMDRLSAFERGLLKTKISDHVPTGLNQERFNAFKEISFDLVNAEQLINYGISCTAKQSV